MVGNPPAYYLSDPFGCAVGTLCYSWILFHHLRVAYADPCDAPALQSPPKGNGLDRQTRKALAGVAWRYEGDQIFCLGGKHIVVSTVSDLIVFQMPFIERISEYRKAEMKHIRSLLLIRAANNAVAFSLPVLASIVSFIVYAAIGHALDPAVIFTALTLFLLLRLPLQFMRMFRIFLSKAKITEKCLQPWV